MSETIFLSLSFSLLIQVQVTRMPVFKICVPRTVQLLFMINITFLNSDIIEVTEFSHNSILSVFQTKEWGLLPPSLQSVDMVQQQLIHRFTSVKFGYLYYDD